MPTSGGPFMVASRPSSSFHSVAGGDAARHACRRLRGPAAHRGTVEADPVGPRSKARRRWARRGALGQPGGFSRWPLVCWRSTPTPSPTPTWPRWSPPGTASARWWPTAAGRVSPGVPVVASITPWESIVGLPATSLVGLFGHLWRDAETSGAPSKPVGRYAGCSIAAPRSATWRPTWRRAPPRVGLTLHAQVTNRDRDAVEPVGLTRSVLWSGAEVIEGEVLDGGDPHDRRTNRAGAPGPDSGLVHAA
jgi:hypothetical protein